METSNWIRLDNASNIFLAARNDVDTKVFRLTAEMTEPVKPGILQTALNHTYEEYPLFHSTLRRGYFWYYLETNEVNPRIRYENDPPTSPIYESGKTDFLFRVLYRENNIHLEVFHALTDGTGALWFFEDLLTEYIRLRYFNNGEETLPKFEREKDNLEDSFNRYFKEKEQRLALTRLIKPLRNFYFEQLNNMAFLPKPVENQVDEKVYQLKGTHTPDRRPRLMNLNLPLKETLGLARKENVSLTIYLTALFVLSVYNAQEEQNKDTTISVSIPINLRQFFPSITVRNFFSTTKVTYTFKEDKMPDLGDICREIDRQFQEKIEKDALETRLKKLIEYEFNPAARLVLRPIKDLALKIINKLNNRKITVSMSNLGIATLPEGISDYVDNFYFYTSVIRPQFCMISYKDQLNVTFMSPFIETDIFKYFIQHLSDVGLKMTIDSNRVTREELDT